MPRTPLVLLGVGLSVAGVIAAFTPWSLSARTSPPSGAEQRVQAMIAQHRTGQLDQADRVALMESLIAKEQVDDALQLLEEWEQPHPLALRLLQVDLLRRQGNRDAARRALNGLLALHPDQPDVLTLQLQMDIDAIGLGPGWNQVEQRFNAAAKGQRTDLGLRLAEMQI